MFVLDSSEKIGKDNWDKIVNATVTIASKFDLKFARFGVIQYQSFPETSIKLIKFNDDKSLSDTLTKLYYKAGDKRTDLALNSTLDVFKGASVRSGSKVVILVTGGPSSAVFYAPGKFISGEDLLGMPTATLHNAEVAVYAVGVQEGLSDTDKKTLTTQLGVIASNPTADHVFEVADFATLLTEAPKIANKSCIGLSSFSIGCFSSLVSLFLFLSFYYNVEFVKLFSKWWLECMVSLVRMQASLYGEDAYKRMQQPCP